MKNTTTKKRGLAAIFFLCPARHVLALLGALVIALHLATRENYALNRTLSEHFVRPVHRFLSRVTAILPFCSGCVIAPSRRSGAPAGKKVSLSSVITWE